MCREAPNAATMQPSACFHYASPAFPIQKTHSPHPILHSHKAPFGVCVFVITWLIPTCLCDATGVHTPIETGKKRSVYCKLVKRKKDSHRFPLWPDFQLETRGLTPCVPEERAASCILDFAKGSLPTGRHKGCQILQLQKLAFLQLYRRHQTTYGKTFISFLTCFSWFPPDPKAI